MGVYIKGMVMPDNCMKCILRVRDKNKSWCLVSGKRLARPLLEIMPSGCPLIEVPEPHGRLIDESKYFEIVNQQDTDPKYNSYSDINDILLDAFDKVPTAIEVEGK